MNLPQSYFEKMKKLLGDDFDLYLKSFEVKNNLGLRVNTLKITPENLRNSLDFNLESINWCKEGFYYDNSVRPSKHPYYHAGLFYIQEPSAMSTGAILPIEKGDKVLDLCAAPGGKSTQVASKLQGEGIIISNDISSTRCKALLKNIEISGITNAIVTNETPEKISKKFKMFFNKIIVDAPCSGEGMFRKDPDAIKNWEGHKSEFCCSLQREILTYANEMLDVGGIIAYSTCTFDISENEQMIEWFLKNNPNFELVDYDKTTGFEIGRYDLVSEFKDEIKKSGRLMPYKVKGEGHFLALLRKNYDYNKGDFQVCKIVGEKGEKLKDYYDFINENLNIYITENIEIHGTSVFKIPLGIDLSGIRVIRSGYYIGELKKNRFEPSQAFAMGLKKEDVKKYINLSLDDKRVIRYLKGESFEVAGKEGWNLILVDGYPLGWGKVQKGRLKNKYLPSWKME